MQSHILSQTHMHSLAGAANGDGDGRQAKRGRRENVQNRLAERGDRVAERGRIRLQPRDIEARRAQMGQLHQGMHRRVST